MSTDVCSFKCDVTSMESMNAVASQVFGRFPDMPVSLICANAGFGGPGLLDGEAADIQRQLDVLISGVIWTFKAFQDKFLSQTDPCALVTTASVAGVVPSQGSYGVGKHGAVAVMESIHGELASKGVSHVKAHVLCPGVVDTGSRP